MQDEVADADAQRAFEKVEEKGQRGRFFARNAQHVGRAGVAAAVAAHVLMREKARQDDGRADAAEQIAHHGDGDQREDQRFKIFHSVILPSRRARARSCAPACLPGRKSRGCGFRDTAGTKNGRAPSSSQSR